MLACDLKLEFAGKGYRRPAYASIVSVPYFVGFQSIYL
jgi:hypothetical protein